MKSYTTYQAFAEMIKLRGIHNDLEVSDGSTRKWRKLVRDHPDDPSQWKISIERMEQLLEKFGYTVIQEKLWKKERKF